MRFLGLLFHLRIQNLNYYWFILDLHAYQILLLFHVYKDVSQQGIVCLVGHGPFLLIQRATSNRVGSDVPTRGSLQRA